MSRSAESTACSHCQLPIGQLGQQRELQGETRWFCCYGCCLAWQVLHGDRDEPQAAAALIRLGVGGFLAMNVMLFALLSYAGAFSGEDAWLQQPVHWLSWALTTPLVLLLGRPFAEGAWQALKRGRLSTDALVCIGVLGAYGYSTLQVLRGSEWVYFDTAGMVLLLFTLGRYLEAQARVRASRSLAPMLAAERAEVRVVEGGAESLLRAERRAAPKPDRASRETRLALVASKPAQAASEPRHSLPSGDRPAYPPDEGLSFRSVMEVRTGDLVRILPGERIAIDGVVTEGRSHCDETILTGQAEPQPKAPGALVHAGSLNGNGLLLVRATAPGTDTRWIEISRQVRRALAGKSMAGVTVDRVAAVFIPAVLLLAVATAWFWVERGQSANAWFAGLAVLVVACPCSLGLAAPMAHTLAIGQAAQRGLLIRGGGVLEKLARLNGVAFDKTGTLTQASLQAVSLHVDGAPQEQVLRVSAALARASDHPVARAVAGLRAGDVGRSGSDAGEQATGIAADVEERPGEGLRGRVEGLDCALGSAAFMQGLGWAIPPGLRDAAPEGSTLVFAGWDGHVTGAIGLGALPLPEAGAVIAELHRRRLRTLLLSGDRRDAVERIAVGLRIERWRAELRPVEKVHALRDWATETGEVAMVGDGLNDGPVLAAAGVGIAVGDASDLARESADVVLPPARLDALPWLLDLALAARRSLRINLAWAFAYNAVGLALAASGLLQPVIAAALMAGSSVLVAARSWRASTAAARAEGRRDALRSSAAQAAA